MLIKSVQYDLKIINADVLRRLEKFPDQLLEFVDYK